MNYYKKFATAVVLFLIFLFTCGFLIPWLVSMDSTVALIGGLLIACLVLPVLCVWALNSLRIAYETLTSNKETK